MVTTTISMPLPLMLDIEGYRKRYNVSSLSKASQILIQHGLSYVAEKELAQKKKL